MYSCCYVFKVVQNVDIHFSHFDGQHKTDELEQAKVTENYNQKVECRSVTSSIALPDIVVDSYSQILEVKRYKSIHCYRCVHIHVNGKHIKPTYILPRAVFVTR